MLAPITIALRLGNRVSPVTSDSFHEGYCVSWFVGGYAANKPRYTKTIFPEFGITCHRIAGDAAEKPAQNAAENYAP
jgi:hypothetical protein